MEVILVEYGNQFSVTKTFYEWCIENNRLDLNDRFDIGKNRCTTKDIGYQSNKKYWFKCPRNIHESEEFYVSVFVRNPLSVCKCKKCNSVAQAIIDKYGEDYLLSHWHSDNTTSPWNLAASNNINKVIIQCDKYKYHVYSQIPRSFVNGIGCPYCINRKVHPLDSLGTKYPDVVNRWSDKNERTPYEYAPFSNEKAWFTCPNNVHDDYIQTIYNATNYGFTCRKCETEKFGKEHRGEKSSSWKGGVTPTQKILRNQIEYNKWRDKVYQRDNYMCQCCGKRGGRLNSHHIYPFADYNDLRFNVDNGLTLCENCHDSTKNGSFHNLYGTHKNTPEQLREYILDKSNIDIFETHPEILSLNAT